MDAPDSIPVTAWLRAWRSGEAGAADSLMPVVYRQLHGMAAQCLRGESPGHTLSATALVHEAYLRLAGTEVDWHDRVHFYAIAARVIRRILIDHARARQRVKRGSGGPKITLDEAVVLVAEPREDLLDLDRALTELAVFDPRRAGLVELIYFGGMEIKEAAAVEGISESTAYRELKLAKAWLYTRLEAGEDELERG